MARIPLSKLLAASLAGHSELYRWMLEHADDLERAISVANRPNWPALARTFGEAGLTDRNGNPPNPEVTRQSWFKVRKASSPPRAARPSCGTLEEPGPLRLRPRPRPTIRRSRSSSP